MSRQHAWRVQKRKVSGGGQRAATPPPHHPPPPVPSRRSKGTLALRSFGILKGSAPGLSSCKNHGFIQHKSGVSLHICLTQSNESRSLYALSIEIILIPFPTPRKLSLPQDFTSNFVFKNNGKFFSSLLATGRFILLNYLDFFLVSVLVYLVLLDATKVVSSAAGLVVF